MRFSFTLDYRQIILSLSAVTTLIVFLYTLIKGKRKKTTTFFLLFLLIVLNMQVMELMIVSSYNENDIWFFTKIKLISVTFIGISWTNFSVSVNSSFRKYKVLQCILLLLSIMLYVISITNNHHFLYFTYFTKSSRGFGIFFWINLIEIYLCIIIGTYNLFKHYLVTGKGKDVIFLSLTAIIPILANALHISKILIFTFDITTIAIPLPLILIVYTLFFARFFNVMPIALSKIYNNLEEAIIVIDSENTIVSVNNTFTQLFSPDYFNYFQGNSIDIFIKSLEKVSLTQSNLQMLTDIKQKYFNCEIELSSPEKRILRVKSCNSNGSSTKYLGKYIMFQDVTIYKKMLFDIEEKNCELAASNEELIAINDQLNEHIFVMEELTLYKERNRIAREVHDTLGHTLTLIMSHMIISKNIINQDPIGAVEKLDEAINITKNGLSEVRYSIIGLTEEKNSQKNLVESIERLVRYSSISGIHIQYSVIGNEYLPTIIHSNKYDKVVEACTKICREAITNAMRHGKAKEISIILKFSDQRIKLYILDNGTGCKEIKKGLGLTGMDARANEMEGKIIYGSDGETGFHIQVDIPVAFDTRD